MLDAGLIMTNFCRYIEDGQIIGGPQALPTNWRDKGDISEWPREALKREGWLPNVVVDKRVEGEVDAGWTDRLEADRVVQTLFSEPAPLTTKSREQLKVERQAAVDAITVTVGDKVFDGDEISQERMTRALTVAGITGQSSCIWVLHDNTAAKVTRDELAMALALSMQAQAAIWVLPG
jgi:hypothetical protein